MLLSLKQRIDIRFTRYNYHFREGLSFHHHRRLLDKSFLHTVQFIFSDTKKAPIPNKEKETEAKFACTLLSA